jgi:hypothetical protein
MGLHDPLQHGVVWRSATSGTNVEVLSKKNKNPLASPEVADGSMPTVLSEAQARTGVVTFFVTYFVTLTFPGALTFATVTLTFATATAATSNFWNLDGENVLRSCDLVFPGLSAALI